MKLRCDIWTKMHDFICFSSWTDVKPFLFFVFHFVQEDLGLSETTYELCYNTACALIGQGQLTEAFNKLQQAEGLFVCSCSRAWTAYFP